MDDSITLDEAATLIAAVPECCFMLQGEPGIGKSSVLRMLRNILGDDNHVYSYVDVPTLDLGDVAMPSINRQTRTTEYFPNNRFGLHTGKIPVICLDEFSKGADPVKNMLHPLLEERKRLADISPPAGTIVFLTGNLSSDGVGDNIKAHTLNRVARVTVRKPSATEWLRWAEANNIHPTVRGWVRNFPDALASYVDAAQASNPYIYNPRKPQQSYVSPRSLSRASSIIHQSARLPRNALVHALAGTAGDAFAQSMTAYLNFASQLPPILSIATDPAHTRVPTESGAQAILTYGLIDATTKETIDPFMIYISRLSPDWAACYCISIAKNKDKSPYAFSNSRFRDWCANNQDLL